VYVHVHVYVHVYAYVHVYLCVCIPLCRWILGPSTYTEHPRTHTTRSYWSRFLCTVDISWLHALYMAPKINTVQYLWLEVRFHVRFLASTIPKIEHLWENSCFSEKPFTIHAYMDGKIRTKCKEQCWEEYGGSYYHVAEKFDVTVLNVLCVAKSRGLTSCSSQEIGHLGRKNHDESHQHSATWKGPCILCKRQTGLAGTKIQKWRWWFRRK
jgi:hypothetical protein